MGQHVPKPPVHLLEGMWLIEKAEKGPLDTVPLGRRSLTPMRTWALTVRHVETGVLDHVRARALSRTEYVVGTEVAGRIVDTYDGPWFRRDRGLERGRRRRDG